MKHFLLSIYVFLARALFIGLFVICGNMGYAQNIRYVDASKVPGVSQNGTTWAKAYPTLKEALEVAHTDITIEEIHVAQGTYYPTGTQSGTDRDLTFGLYRGNLKLLGGFPTGGGSRNIKANPTILSGEINNAARTDDNSRHVMVIAGLGAEEELLMIDGFSIQWGHATGNNAVTYNNQDIARQNGGGVAIVNNNNRNNIHIFNCVISGNWAENTGAGFYIKDSFPILGNCLIAGNYADYGGGIFNYDKAIPWIISCTIAGNHSNNSGGGGMRNSGEGTLPRLVNTIIYGNRGGGVVNYNDGALTAAYSLIEGRDDLGPENLGSTTNPQFVNLVVPTTANTDGDYRLLSTSPCIDMAADFYVRELLETDLDQNLRIVCTTDMGAYEFPKFVRILTHPVSASYCKSRVTSFSVTASYATQYQWEVKQGDAEFTPIQSSESYSGINTSTLVINHATLEMKGYQYRCVAKNDCGSEDLSNAAVLTMENLIQITKQPVEVIDCAERSAVFNVEALNVAGYQWQVNTGTGFVNVVNNALYSGATTSILKINTTSTTMAGYEYRCVLSHICLPDVVTNPAMLTSKFIAIRFVKAGATGSGLSWNDASGNLQKMIDESCDGAEIWVAGGTYKPTEIPDGLSDNRNKTFVMRKDIKLYGGFAGTEQAIAQRNPLLLVNKSILSGDLDGNNGFSANDASHVVIAAGNMGTAILDGFTITGGNAYTNSVIINNYNIDGAYGGGLYVVGTSLVVRNVSFTKNKASIYGGGMYNAQASILLEQCVFAGNSARDGGGIYNLESICTVSNSLFSGNAATSTGGGLHNFTNCVTNFTNVTFSGNDAALGGGIFNNDNSSVNLKSSILWGNSTDIRQFNSVQVFNHSLLSSTEAGIGNLNVDPNFIHAPSYKDAPFVGGDYHLEPCSPAINAGDPSASMGSDLEGQTRIQLSRVDMGAYEMAQHFVDDNANLVSTSMSMATGIQVASGKTWYAAECNQLLVSVTSSGSAPVTGRLNATVWINNQPQFVGRYYEITPENNATTATGKVTLYFTQAEFDAYNAQNKMKLPTNVADENGKANLRIQKRSGRSNDNSGMPISYPGAAVEIDPDDTDIIWNVALARWEVSFGVVGFSGFFAYAKMDVLPVSLTRFEALKMEAHVRLIWQTTSESGASHFELQRSADAKSWENIDIIPADGERNGLREYMVLDGSPLKGLNYYRLKMVDLDGQSGYSKIVNVQWGISEKQELIVYPNPVKHGILTVNTPEEGFDLLALYNLLGQKVKVKILSQTAGGIKLDVSQLAIGVYLIKMQKGQRKEVKTFVVDQ